jgi:penicillin-binding protein 1A
LNTPTAPSQNSVPPGRRVVKLGLLALLGLSVAAVLAVAVLVMWYAVDLPPLDEVTDYKPRQSMQVFTADGVEIAQFGSERRRYVAIAQTPQLLKDTVLAVEDAGFYEHGGISLRGIARAFIANLTGGMPQGASTITQQVARTFFLSTRRTPERKIKEALLALRIERALDKDQILELYLNQIYLGQRSYGFGAAAQSYFGKTLDELDLAETAMLAGLPQNPIYANPIANLPRAQRRQRVVLGRLVAVGRITQAEAEAAAAQTLVLRSPRQVTVPAQHVAEMARQAVVARFGERAYTEGIRVTTSIRSADQQAATAAVRAGLLAHDRRGPYRGPEGQEDLPTAGRDAAAESAATESAVSEALKDYRDDGDLRLALVQTASPREVTARLASGEAVKLDSASLRWARAALAPKAKAALALKRGSVIRVLEQPGTRQRDGKTAASTWTLAQWPQAEGAFVSLDPHSGRVRALVGGFDFNRNQFNRATNARRQPGSAFKPFLYSAALENGISLDTRVLDGPLLNDDGSVPKWNPQNSDDRFDGPMTLRQALARSKNLVSVRLLQHLGLPVVRPWLERFGFDLDRQPRDLTLALGSGSTTPMELAAAYAVLANGGWQRVPVVIERITGPKGEVLFEAPAPGSLAEAQRVIPARNAFLVSELLNEVTRSGTAARAQAVLGRPDVYGKTGTTNDAVDAWFAGWAGAPGYLPALATGLPTAVVAVAWMGYDDPKSLGSRESGGGLSLPVWMEALRPALRSLPVREPVVPGGLVRAGGEWRYAEWADGSPVSSIGLDTPRAPSGVPGMPPVPGHDGVTAPPTPATPTPPAAQATQPPARAWGGVFDTGAGIEGTGAGPGPLSPVPAPRVPTPARSGGR